MYACRPNNIIPNIGNYYYPNGLPKNSSSNPNGWKSKEIDQNSNAFYICYTKEQIDKEVLKSQNKKYLVSPLSWDVESLYQYPTLKISIFYQSLNTFNNFTPIEPTPNEKELPPIEPTLLNLKRYLLPNSPKNNIPIP